MSSSLIKNIFLEIKKLKEQAPPEPTAPAPASPPEPAQAATPASPETMPTEPGPDVGTPDLGTPSPTENNAETPPGDEAGDEQPSEDDSSDENEVPPGQPPVDPNNPSGAVLDYINDLTLKTIDTNTIVKGAKSSIQSNFLNYEDAKSVVNDLKNAKNIDVARKLELFITGKITENKNKGSETMKVSKQEIRELVREAVKSQTAKPTKKEVKLTKEQFEKIVRNAVVRKLNEGALFDTYRSQIDQEQSAIEQQLTSADIRRMAIDLFEKICDKTGVDVDSDNPESPAMKFVTAELDRMVTSAQEVANKLIQVATVVKTAAGATPKKEEGQG